MLKWVNKHEAESVKWWKNMICKLHSEAKSKLILSTRERIDEKDLLRYLKGLDGKTTCSKEKNII